MIINSSNFVVLGMERLLGLKKLRPSAENVIESWEKVKITRFYSVGSEHGQNLADRTKPGPSFQL